jgi:hypothetical protein
MFRVGILNSLLAVTGSLFRRMNQTLETWDNEGFNESFDFLYRSNQWAICGMLVATFYGLLNIWVTWSAAVAAARLCSLVGFTYF